MKRNRMILFVCLFLVLIGSTIGIFLLVFQLNDNIPKELQIERMNYYFANDESRKFENVHPSDPCLYEFTVVDLKETSTGLVPWGGNSDYTIHVTYDLLNNRKESFYVTVRIFGTPTVQVYGQPRLVVGDSYVMISKKFNGNDDYAGNAYLFKQWEYEGERYIYPYPVSDTQIFGNGVPFEFVEELSVYDSQNDRDVIEFLEDRGVELPVFKYKYELNSFIDMFKEVRQEILESREEELPPESYTGQ